MQPSVLLIEHETTVVMGKVQNKEAAKEPPLGGYRAIIHHQASLLPNPVKRQLQKKNAICGGTIKW